MHYTFMGGRKGVLNAYLTVDSNLSSAFVGLYALSLQNCSAAVSSLSREVEFWLDWT